MLSPLKVMLFCVFLLFLGCGVRVSYAQIDTKGMSYEKATKTLKKDNPKMIYIVIYDSRQGLYGSKCVTEFTRNMGFEYIIPGTPDELDDKFKIFWRNRWSKLRLTFKNGLFWQKKVEKQIRKCRKNSGDFLG